MATRLNRRHTEMVLRKIQASQLINRLQEHVLNGLEMKDSQIRAADILLRKVLADQKAIEHSNSGRRKPREMTMQELDERIARLSAREAQTDTSTDEPAPVH